MANISLEAAQAKVKESGTKIRLRMVRTPEYVWKCKNPRCPKSKTDGAIRGTVYNWVVYLAASHLAGEARKREKTEKRKALEKVLLES